MVQRCLRFDFPTHPAVTEYWLLNVLNVRNWHLPESRPIIHGVMYCDQRNTDDIDHHAYPTRTRQLWTMLQRQSETNAAVHLGSWLVLAAWDSNDKEGIGTDPKPYIFDVEPQAVLMKLIPGTRILSEHAFFISELCQPVASPSSRQIRLSPTK